MHAIQAKTFSGYRGLQQMELGKPQPAPRHSCVVEAESMVPGVQFEVEMVERAARARLVDEMRKDGVKVALSIGTRAIDMLASVESGD